MMNILRKYKKTFISSGILLSILASSTLMNFNLLQENTISQQGEVKTSSIVEDHNEELILEKDLESKNKEEIKDDIEESSDLVAKEANLTKNDNTENSIKAKNEEKAKSTQTKETNKNSSNAITGEKYTVRKGDTLFLIAQRANVSMNHLKQINNLSSDVIYENQILKIKGITNNTPTEVANRGSQRSEDLYWLSRIIHAEAQGESYEGKVAVGNVIINRVNSSKFPNTIKGVVFDKQDGYTQFSPVIDGTIYNTPDAESIKAATAVLNGSRPVGNALYFLNPRKSTNFWIVQNRQYMKTIGLHDFYY